MFIPILQTIAYRYQLCISLAPYICLYPSNYNIRYLPGIPDIQHQIHTHANIYTYAYTHIYTRANIPTATGYPFRPLTIYEYRISVFQGVWITGVQDFTLEDFQYLVLAPLLRRLATDISSLSYSRTPGHQHQWRIIDNNTP